VHCDMADVIIAFVAMEGEAGGLKEIDVVLDRCPLAAGPQQLFRRSGGMQDTNLVNRDTEQTK